MINETDFITNFCWVIFCLATLTATLLYYAIIIYPKQIQKRIEQAGGTVASKEEIDQLFEDKADPFSETEFAEFSHSKTIWN